MLVTDKKHCDLCTWFLEVYCEGIILWIFKFLVSKNLYVLPFRSHNFHQDYIRVYSKKLRFSWGHLEPEISHFLFQLDNHYFSTFPGVLYYKLFYKIQGIIPCPQNYSQCYNDVVILSQSGLLLRKKFEKNAKPQRQHWFATMT